MYVVQKSPVKELLKSQVSSVYCCVSFYFVGGHFIGDHILWDYICYLYFVGGHFVGDHFIRDHICRGPYLLLMIRPATLN